MAMEISSRIICPCCGLQFTQRKGNFMASYAAMHKGIGFLPYCNSCVDNLYKDYYSKTNDDREAVKRLCRKLDLFWSDDIFTSLKEKTTSRNVAAQYISRLSNKKYIGRSYDDTIAAQYGESRVADALNNGEVDGMDLDGNGVPKEWTAFWGSGYAYDMYVELEQRRSYYMSRLPDGYELDIGSESLIRQICNLEVSIAKDSAVGKSIDKSVNSLNTLLGSLNLKPAQKKDVNLEAELTNTPLGLWLYRYENKRPLPEIDQDLKDVNHIKKYVFTWMGHLCKMLNVRNGYTKLYEEEIERLKVEKPEYDGDDEDLLIDSYSDPPEEI